MKNLVYLLRAMQLYAHSAHHNSKGPAFFLTMNFWRHNNEQ